MILFHGINLFLLLFITTFTGCDTASSTTISSPSLPPTTLPSNKEKIERVVAFHEGITAITEVFNSPLTIGKNLKKLLDASRKCGLVLYKGLLIDEISDSPEAKKLRQKMEDFYHVTKASGFNISSAAFEATLYHSIYEIQDHIIEPLEHLMNAFIMMLKTHKLEDLNYFKKTCSDSFPIMILRFLQTLAPRLKYTIIKTDYSDRMYNSLNIIYQNALKQTLGLFPICNLFMYGLAGVEEGRPNFAKFIAEIIQDCHKNFTFLNNERKKNFWNKKVITKPIKKIIVDADNAYSNSDIATAIFDIITFKYSSFGYNYHVGVSDAAKLGHNDTVLQCSTECNYLYNFLGKDIYVIRTLKTKNNYSFCDYLEELERINPKDSLEPLANKIFNRCKGVAFSLVRERLHYFGKDGSDECKNINSTCEKQGFTSKYQNGIHIVFANYPLK